MTTQFVDERPRGDVVALDKRSVEVAGAGSMAETIAAAAAIVLAIIGLAGVLTATVTAVTTIVLGAGVLMDAAAIGARYNRLTSEVWANEGHVVRAELGGGISAGSLAGIAGIVLGILALLGVAPGPLSAVALIVFGAALLIGSAARSRLASLHTVQHEVGENARRIIDEAISFSAGGEVLIGVGAFVLGILTLLGQPANLVLVGFLAVGASMLLSGSAFGARMFEVMRRLR